MKKITLLIALFFTSNMMFSQIFFEDDFDGSGPGLAGWTLVNNDGLTPNAAVAFITDAWAEIDKDGADGNFGGPAGDIAAMSTSWYAPAGTSDDWMITPVINLATDATLTWDARAADPNFPDGYEVRISTTGTNIATDFNTVLFSIAGENPVFITRTVDLATYTGQNVYIAWVNNANDQFLLLVDNVDVSVTPSCTVPTDFVANTITTTNVDIAWTDTNDPGTTWEIEWGTDGFMQGSGTTVPSIATPSYNFTGLTAETAYDFYIRANCIGGLGDSDWVGPISFSSAFDCSIYSIPSNEIFDNNNAFLSCYTIEDVDGDGISWISQQDLDLDGDAIPETFATNGNSTGNTKDDWLFSPAFSLVGGAEYEVTTIFNTFTGDGSFEAFIVPTPSSTATPEATLFSMTNIVQQGDFATLETMAYQNIDTFTPATSGTFHIAYHSFGPANSGFILMFDSNIDATLGINDFDANVFKHFYDKNTEVLSLESSTLPLTGIEIYNILGQRVLTESLSQTEEQINLSSITDGVYLAKINIDGNFKTIKFVKQ